MKCITLTEPWATLIKLGYKKIETRSWKTNYRGKIAIHCAKTFPKYAKEECLKEPYYKYLKEFISTDSKGKKIYDFPFGNIILIADLVDCVKMKSLSKKVAILDNGQKVIGDELVFGEYNPDRYAWILENIKVLKTPIPAKGQLGLWNFDIEYQKIK